MAMRGAVKVLCLPSHWHTKISTLATIVDDRGGSVGTPSSSECDRHAYDVRIILAQSFMAQL
jgi:hypothetical protein